MLDGVMLGCAVGALLGDSVVRAMLDGVTLSCAVHRYLYVPPVTPKVTQSYPKKQQVPGYR